MAYKLYIKSIEYEYVIQMNLQDEEEKVENLKL